MMDGEDGCLEGWVGSWAVDRCQAWRGWHTREGRLVVWQGTAVTLSLRRTYCVCLIIELESWTACYHQSDQFPLVMGPRGCEPCRMEREVVWYIAGTRGLPMEVTAPARS